MKKRVVITTLTLSAMLLASPAAAFAGTGCPGIPGSGVKGNILSSKDFNLNCNMTQSCVKNGNCTELDNLFKQYFPNYNQNFGKDCNGNSSNCTGNTCDGVNKPSKPSQKPEKPIEKPETPPVKPSNPTEKPGGNQGTEEAPGNIGSYEQQVVNLVNKERAAAGLSPLKVNTKLSAVAEKKAEDMRDKGYFSHTSPTYGSPFDMMKQFGITYKAAGENIAKGQKTPDSVMNGWMNSSGHKANILSTSYDQIGVGYVKDSNGTTYWVQMFMK